MAYFRETAALSALNEAIKRLESEMQNMMDAGEPIQFHPVQNAAATLSTAQLCTHCTVLYVLLNAQSCSSN